MSKKYLKVLAGGLIGLAAGIGLPLLEKYLPPDHGDAFSGFVSGMTVFMEIATLIVVAVILGAYVWRYAERRRNLRAGANP